MLHRVFHAKYLSTALGPLPAGFVTLDASRAWICYWALHGLALLEAPLPGEEGWPCSTVPTSGTDVVAFLASCQSPTGGFGGGPGHLSHLATSYAAVCALVTLGTEEALRVVDRASMADFLRRMAVPQERGGGFTVHNGKFSSASAWLWGRIARAQQPDGMVYADLRWPDFGCHVIGGRGAGGYRSRFVVLLLNFC